MTGKALTKPWKALELHRFSDFYYNTFKPAINVYLVLHFCNLYSIPYLVVTWTVYDQANKYICLKSGLCWYSYASIGLFKTIKFVFKKRKNQNAIFLPFTCCSDNFRFALISKRFELCNWGWWHLKENSM